MDVGVDRKGRHVEREGHHDGRRLGPHALETEQPLPGLVRRGVTQEFEIELTSLGRDLAQDVLNARPLLVRQTGRADGCDHRAPGCVAHGFPRREPAPKGMEGAIAVEVVGVLREDSRDQFVERWKRVAPVRLTVDLKQPVVDRQRAPPQSLHPRIINATLLPERRPLLTINLDGRFDFGPPRAELRPAIRSARKASD
jgi:hypothetical protein